MTDSSAGQRTSGLLSVFSAPIVYRTYQHAIGSPKVWRRVVEMLGVQDGEHLLDLGCGPGDLVDYLPDVAYTGIDLSESYIEYAKQHREVRGQFIAADATTMSPDELGTFDRVMMHGLLHHLDDDEVVPVVAAAARACAPHGRVMAVDGCYRDGQSRIAKFLLDRDRGQAVRDEDGYRSILEQSFDHVEIHILEGVLRIPYTVCVAVCEQPRR